MPVLTSEQQNGTLKRTKIRYTEYYDLQSTLDKLYADSKVGKSFSNLMGIITQPENIKLAYRSITGNKGSNTPGVDGRTIKDLAKLSEEQYITLIQRQFHWYHPQPVKRVEIPKPNGKTRPLGIPTIVDRIVQQCILQVMEPICEARFHDNSNGFRPNRGAENAIAQCCRLMQVQNLHYVVDIDIKGFFDNVCHHKLMRQLWNIGIRDKTLLSIIKAMLKAQIVLPDGTRLNPEKGTPQGGILSPLLSNIVLNELDWWITSQWEEMPTHYPYKHRQNKAGAEIKSHTYRALRRSNLKEMHIVRYADDFKIFCRSHADAQRAFMATKLWLKDRLKLDISEEKSAVVNLKKKYSNFLGFKLKVSKKGKKFTVCSHMSDKAKQRAKEQLSECVREIKCPKIEKGQFAAIQRYNATVAGMHNYYQFATRVFEDFDHIGYGIKKQLGSRLKELTRKGTLKKGFIKERYGMSKQIRFLNGQPLIPVAFIRTKDAQHKRKSINRYTPEGRAEIHKNLAFDTNTMLWLMRNPAGSMTIEFADNRVSLYAAQYGKCAVTGEPLLPHDVYCHHKKPKEQGGTDEFTNLVLVTEAVHVLIHAIQPATIELYLHFLHLTKSQLTKLNKLREQAGNPAIV